jgi:hypothetical protein
MMMMIPSKLPCSTILKKMMLLSRGHNKPKNTHFYRYLCHLRHLLRSQISNSHGPFLTINTHTRAPTHTHTHTLSLSLCLVYVSGKRRFTNAERGYAKSRAYAEEGAADRWRIMNSELLRRTEANDVNCPSLVRDARKTGHVCWSSEACLLVSLLACHHLHLLVPWNVQRQDQQLFFSLPLLREFLL